MKKIQSIGVYCSANAQVASVYIEAAREVGEALAHHHITMVYGGGDRSMMGAAANAAMAHNGRVIGFMPKHLRALEAPSDHITEIHMVDTMHTRKQCMFENSDAFFVLPGGFGTLDEVFELITWRYLKLHEKPIIFININQYWDPLLVMIKNIFDQNFSNARDENLFHFVSSVAEAFQFIMDADG